MLCATAACNFSTSEVQKLLRSCEVLYILTSKCASHHSGLPFFDIETSKIAPKLRCFVHFDLQMRFAPQRRAIFHFAAETATSAPAALASLLFEHPEPRIIEQTQRFVTFLTVAACVSSFYSDSTSVLIVFLLTWLLYSAFQLSIFSEIRRLNFLR